MKHSTQKIWEMENPACHMVDGVAHERNSIEAILGRACFVAYLFLIVVAVFSVGMFLIRADGLWLAGMLVAILGVGVLRYVGYAYLRFEDHQSSLDCGFECHGMDSEFDRWFHRVEELERMPERQLWERYALRKSLLREYRLHPAYSRKLLDRGYQPPDWLGM